jgi:hypothetical protein
MGGPTLSTVDRMAFSRWISTAKIDDASYWCKGFLQPQPPFQPYKPLLQLLCLNLCPSYVRKAKENKRAIEGFLDNKLDPPASKKNKNSS